MSLRSLILKLLGGYGAIFEYHPVLHVLLEDYPEDLVAAVLRTSGAWEKWRYYVAALTGESPDRADEVYNRSVRLLKEARREIREMGGVNLKKKGLWGLGTEEGYDQKGEIKELYSPSNLLRLARAEALLSDLFPGFWGERGSYYKWRALTKIDPRELARKADMVPYGLFEPPGDPGEPWTEIYREFLFHPLSDLDIRTNPLSPERAVWAWWAAMWVERETGTRIGLPASTVPFSRNIVGMAAQSDPRIELEAWKYELLRRKHGIY